MITVVDDDEASEGIVLEVAPNRVNEDAGATTLTVTGTLNGSALTTDTLVSLTLAAGTATVTTDYTVSSNTATLTIPAAATSGTASFTLTPVDDVIDDDDETVTIAASTTSALTLSTSSLTVTIADDDEPNAAPVFSPPALTRSLAENSAAGVAVGAAVTATDADNDTLLYSLGVVGAASFTIHSATGQIGTVPGVAYDHEGSRNRYVLTVTADDSRGGVASATVTINISDTDEPPPAPAAPAVSPTRGATDSLEVAWTAPSTTGRPGISGYELLYRSRGGAWAAWPHPGTGIVATISGVIADTSYEVQVRASNDEGASGWSESGEGSTYSEEDLCSAEGPTPAVVAVTSLPIVVASTANVYFVLYVTHELDGVEVWTPVSVTRGTAVSTTLTENVDGLPAARYRVERYSVSDPADIDGDCIDDLAELDALGRLNPLNPAPQIAITDGATAIPDRSTFETLAFSEQTAGHEYVKFALLDMDTDEPLLYWINSKTHRRHPIAFFLETIGHAGPHLPWSIPGEVVYNPNLTATDGTRGVYYFWLLHYDARFTPAFLERVYALLSSAMPLLDDDLPMYIPNQRLGSYRADLDTLRNSRIPLLFNEDVFGNADFLALNHGVGYGRLRVMAPGERPNPRNVVIYETLPNELPRVAGIITGVPQTPLSHVNLRAVQDDVPNAFIDDALGKDEIDDLVDSYVRYEVTADGYALRAATLAEVEAHFAASRPRHVQTPERDLTVTTITALSDVRLDDWRAFGVKAANVAVLGTLGFPAGTVPDGFAVPFYFYDEFMKHTALGEETVFGKGKGAAEDQFTLGADATLIDAVQAILAHPKFQTDFEIQDEMLDDLRDAIEDAQSPQWIIDALTAMHATYPQGQSLRYRSSTNNEDLPGFSGAGLYDSNTQKPDETLEDGIDKSLKQVFASLWNFRAFTEREFHRIDHLATAMGVLVHPNYSDELANGVAVSFDPIRGYSSYYYLNTQLGEDLVTNPDALSEPEEILLHRSGDFYEVLATSNQVTPGSLLMSDAQMDQLADHLTVIHERFAQLYSNRPFAIEIEFKITVDNILAIKQARPWVFSGASTTIEAPVRVSFTQESFTAVEGATASVVVGLSAPSGPFGVTIPIVVTGGTASADEYSAPEPVVFSSGDDRQTVSIPLGDDALIEGDETIALAFGDLPTGVTPGTNATTTVTITDADSAAFEFAISDDEVGEGATVELTVTLDGVATFATAQTIDLTFPGGGASAGVDFTVADSSGQTLTGPYALTLPAGSSSVAATLSIVDDAAEEGNETIVVRAWHGADALGGLQVITILANDEPIVGNTPPVFRDGQSAARSLAENTGPSINIGRPLAARDVDQGDTLTYSLGGTDAGSFDISLTSGQLRTKSGVAYDHEARSSYRVTVSVSDGEATASITVSIAVTDEDEPPAAPVVQVDTASPVSLEVTWLAPATPDRPAVSNYDLRYKLAGESTFIDGPQDVSGTSASIGELIPASSYDVQVRATNAEGDGAWSASQPGVTAVLPVVALILSASSIPEDRGMSTVTATVSPVSPTPFSVEIWATAFPPIPGQFETSLNNILSFAANETQSTGEVVITGLVATVVNVTGTVSPAGVLVKPPARVQLRITAGDPEVTVRFGSATYNVPEGGIRRVSVVLDEDPERTVVIPITKTNQGGARSGDYSVDPDPTNVTFNAGGDLTQTFTFTATPDTDDDDGESVLLGFDTPNLPTRVSVGTTSQSTVRITDDDDPEVTVKFGATSINVGEGDRATITVTISADPERELRIPIIAAGGNGADPTDFRLNPVLVTFPSGSDADRTFTVTAFDDTQDDDGETVELSFGEMPDDRVSPDPDPDSHTSVTVTLVDNDDPVVTVSFRSDKYTVPESDDPATTSDRENQITIKVVLSADPERTVTIPIRKANQDMTGDGDYSGVPSSVTFNAGDTEKAFTFTATPDTVDDDGDSVLLSFGTPLPARVSTLAPIQSTVSITDDDDPEVTVKFGASTLNLGEGNSATITVTISADPERTVVVPFVVTYGVVVGAGANDHSAVPANVIFTAGGDQSQTFSFTATQDDIDDDNERVILGFDTANLPSRVTAVNPSTQTINIGDDDKRGVAVTPLTLSVNEGMDGEYTVVLTSEPTAPVTVTPSTTSTEVTLSGALTFRPGNWGTPQTVTVRAPEDGDAVSEMLTITHTVSGGDYGAVTVSNVAVSLGDNDVAGVAITPSNLTIRENATDTFNVKLNTEPGNDVTVTISSRDAAVATVSLDSLTFTKATSLTFTTIDWNSEQTVTVRGVEDDRAADNNTTITFGVSGYGSVTTAADVTISVTDDDTRAVTISTSALTVEEEAATADPPTNTYTVVLATQPEGNVTLAITSDNADIRVNGRSATATSPYNLTFTGGNWDAPQTVTVTVVNDLDGWNEEATLTHAVRGADYAMVNADSVMVTVTDNDPLGLRVSPAEYTTERVDVTEGTTYSYTLALLTVPLGDVTVDITSDNPDVTVDPTKLTILAAQWNAPHTVKITVAADPDGEDEPATLSHTLSGYGTYTTGPDFLVQVLDGNEPGVFIEPTTLAIPEGFNDAYSVSLRTEPSGTVTVQVAGHAGTDVTVMPDSLTFSSSDWNVPQAVTVTAAEDEDADNDTVTLTHAVSGYGTVTTTDAVTVTIVDRDEEGITVTDVTPPLEDPNEGDTPATGTYTIVLDTQPTGEVMVAITSNNPDVTVMPESLTFTTSDWNQPQTVTVTAVGDADATDDTATLTHQASGSDYSATAAVMVTVTDLDDPPTTSTSTGGGGGGGPSGPSPSKVEFEWNVTRDIETLDSGHDAPTGAWSDGTLLWIAENGDGADDAVYAYDLVTGKRVEDREFELHETNRAPRGLWSNSKTAWVADSGQNRLFAYDLASGERDEEREVALDTRNRDPRGIWSDDGTTVWVLDGGKNALFAYDLATGELIAEHTLDSTNGDPRGLWSDGVTIWVSDHGAKRLFAYRIPQDGETASEDEDDAAEEADLGLERVIDEEFKDLPKASNNSPRGIWSDGDVMYVADESDAKVYSYNLPAAIDARLASLTLSGVEFGEFLSRSTEYEGVADEGVTETTVEAEAARRGATVAIAPADADEATDGHQLALDGVEAITVTVTSADGSRTKVYLVRFAEAAEAEQPVVACLRGAVTVGFSLLIYGGGSVAELLTCAESRSVTALYVPHDGKYVSYILGAPDFVNSAFREVYPDGVPALTPLTVKSEGPPSPAPPSDDVPEFGPECLRGAIATGFSLVLYEGGSVEALDTCAQRLGVTALYALVDGEWVSYILGAPAFVNREFRELFTDGLPALTPLVGKRDAP